MSLRPDPPSAPIPSGADLERPARRVARAALLGLGAAALHGAALRGTFVWDDLAYRAAWVHGATRLADVFLSTSSAMGNPLYRPLTFLSEAADERLWGSAAAGWHLTNLVLHGVAVALFHLVAGRLFAPHGERRALLATAIVALHPATSEVACWIMARGDSLSLAFGLSATLAAIAAAKRSGAGSSAFAWASGVLALAALWSKETGVLWLVIAPAAGEIAARDARTTDDPARRAPRATRLLPLTMAALVYATLRSVALGNVPATSTDPGILARLSGLASVHGVRSVLGASGFYSVQAVLPVRYLPYVETVPTGGIGLALGALAIASSLVVLVRTVRSAPRIALGIAWSWLAVAPSVLTAHDPVSSNALADRHLYAALPGLAIAAAEWWRDRQRRRVAVFAVAAITLAALSIARDRVWRDELALWGRVVEATPDCRYALGNLAMAMRDAGRTADAEALLRRAVASDEPGPALRVESASLLALVLLDQGRVDDAAEALDGLDPRGLDATGTQTLRLVRGLVAWMKSMRPAADDGTGDAPERGARARAAQTLAAAAEFEAAVAAYPFDATAHHYLGLALERLGERVDAVHAFARAARLGAGTALGTAAETRRAALEAAVRAETDPYRRAFEEGRAAQREGRTLDALVAYGRAAAANAAAAAPRVRAAECAMSVGEPATAARLQEEAAALEPESPSILFNLGFYRSAAGDDRGAAAAFEDHLRRRPEHAKAHANLAEAYRRLGRPADAAREYRAFLDTWTGDDGSRREIERRLRELAPSR